MTKKQKERARREAAERRQAAWLKEHKAWNWQWPGPGSLDDPFDLQRNCWFTNNPKPKYPKAPGDQHVVEGPQTYYGVTEHRKSRRQSRRRSPRLLRAGLKFGRAHSYPGKTEGGF